jgi:hypothetical protein
MVGGLASVLSIAACSNKVLITAETTGTAAGSGGSVATSTTGSSIGGTGGSTGAGAVNKVITADTDLGQYQSISVDLLTMQPLVQGPFFVTDIVAGNTTTFFTVAGNDCTAPFTMVLTETPGGLLQFHGIRIPILAGQSLCHQPNNGTLTVLGFKPY